LVFAALLAGSCGDGANQSVNPVPGPNFGSKMIGNIIQNSNSTTGTTVPIAGAKVRLPGTNMGVISDKDGHFIIYGLSDGTYDLLVETDYGFVRHIQNIEVALNSVKDVGDIVIEVSGEITGRITLDSSTSDVKGVAIFIHGTGQHALTDEDGEYRISGIPPGEISVSASRDLYCAETVNNIVLAGGTFVSVPDMDLTTCDTQTASLTGFAFLTNSTSHDGILITDVNGGNTTRTTEDGSWVLDGVEPGPYQLVFSKQSNNSVTLNNIVATPGVSGPSIQNVILKPANWRDVDGDGVANGMDDDADNDEMKNNVDLFKFRPTEWSDHDDDGIGDIEDMDADDDGVIHFWDCDDFNSNAWVSCVSCIDGDSDNYFSGCDTYFDVEEDCDDKFPWLWASCNDSFDEDNDGHYTFYDTTEKKTDCDDDNEFVYPGAREYCDGISNQCPAAEIDAGCALEIIEIFETGKPIRNMKKKGNYLYFLSPDLTVLDVSDPSSPVVVGKDTIYGPQTAFDLNETENGDLLAYMVYSYFNTLTIIDVTDPLDMFLVGDSIVSQPIDIMVDSVVYPVDGSTVHTTAYIMRAKGALDTWNVSNPSSPLYISTFINEIQFFGGIWNRNMLIMGNWDTTLVVGAFDISNPEITLLNGGVLLNKTTGYDSFINGSYLNVSASCRNDTEPVHGFFIGDYMGLVINNVPVPITQGGDTCIPLEPQAIPDGIHARGDFVYVAANEGGLQIFNTGDINHVAHELTFDTAPYNANKILVSGDYAYLTVDQERKLYIIDVSEFQ
jgi:hypothetical protein